MNAKTLLERACRAWDAGLHHGYYGLKPLWHRRRPYPTAEQRRHYNDGFILGRRQRRQAEQETDRDA